MTGPVYSVQLPAGARMLSGNFRLLFFICCGFTWNPAKTATSALTIEQSTFEQFMDEWAAKIERGKVAA